MLPPDHPCSLCGFKPSESALGLEIARANIKVTFENERLREALKQISGGADCERACRTYEQALAYRALNPKEAPAEEAET